MWRNGRLQPPPTSAPSTLPALRMSAPRFKTARMPLMPGRFWRRSLKRTPHLLISLYTQSSSPSSMTPPNRSLSTPTVFLSLLINSMLLVDDHLMRLYQIPCLPTSTPHSLKSWPLSLLSTKLLLRRMLPPGWMLGRGLGRSLQSHGRKPLPPPPMMALLLVVPLLLLMKVGSTIGATRTRIPELATSVACRVISLMSVMCRCLHTFKRNLRLNEQAAAIGPTLHVMIMIWTLVLVPILLRHVLVLVPTPHLPLVVIHPPLNRLPLRVIRKLIMPRSTLFIVFRLIGFSGG